MIIFQIVNNIAIDAFGGGAELFAIRLAEQLSRTNKIHLIVIWRYNTESEKNLLLQLQDKVEVHFLINCQTRTIHNLFSIVRNWINLIKKYSPQIINSHSALPDLLNSLGKLRFGRRISSIRTVHTESNWFSNSIFNYIFGKMIFPISFNSEIAISKTTKKILDDRAIAKFLKKQSKIIYNGISQKTINYPEEDKHRRDQIKQIITVGRLTEQKGYIYLLKAISLLKNSVPFSVLFLGDGPDKEYLLQQTKTLNLNDIVKFIGFHDNVLDYMAESDLFVSSSLWEGFPTVILEAMALGLPVVATNVSGSCELIENDITGLLVPPKDPVALAEAIGSILNSSERSASFSKNAKIKVKNFSIEKTAKEYEELYLGLSGWQ